MYFDNFQSVQNTADKSQANIPDATGNYTLELSATHANYVSDDINVVSTANQY